MQLNTAKTGDKEKYFKKINNTGKMGFISSIFLGDFKYKIMLLLYDVILQKHGFRVSKRLDLVE